MATQSKIIGRVPVSRQEYIKGMTCFKDNIVTCYGSAFQCIVDSTTTPPATLDASGALVLGAGWKFFADASAARTAGNRIFALERDFGQYAELPSVAMTAETTGKYINADGEFVDDADFNIAAIGAVVVGNTYELYMSSADKMKLGVALFVARIKTTTTSGTERIEYVPLFSAMSTDIPTSGYVCFEAMEAYSDVLVCYRADVPEAATLRVRRYGTKASIATQINNLRKKVDLKSFTDGYYESMRVGTADNLTSKGDATEEVIMSRKAGGDNQIEDGSASIKRIKGYSVILNQIYYTIDGYNKTINGVTVSAENGKICVTGKATDNIYIPLASFSDRAFRSEPKHKYIVLSDLISPNGLLIYCTDDRQMQKWNDVIETGSISGDWYLQISDTFDSSSKVQFTIEIIDLTQMFGPGNAPSTPEAFAKRLGYDSIDDVSYIPYNEGEIVSSFAEGIKTTDTEGKVSERKWSETLKKYFPDGLKSAGSAYDEITPTKAVKRVLSIRVGELIWTEYPIASSGVSFFWGKIDNVPFTAISDVLCDTYISSEDLVPSKEQDKCIMLGAYIGPPASVIIMDKSFTSVEEFVEARKDSVILYALKTPEETTYDELNLTEQVAEGGTEEAIITDGKTSTPLRADIVYPIDAYNTIKANKANIGTLSSLNTASKTDLVSAINELAGKVGALEAKTTEATKKITE